MSKVYTNCRNRVVIAEWDFENPYFPEFFITKPNSVFCNSALHSKKFREINAKLFSRNSWFFSLWAFSRIESTKFQINLHENSSLNFRWLGQFLSIKGNSLCFHVKIQRSNRLFRRGSLFWLNENWSWESCIPFFLRSIP